ncbi:MAG: AAA family ATPase [Candidatus Paralactobacillus gallistercoris]|uniref:AAA family ATPase n=1 Tax=Candidatus Paralactobacillus gallistercoris TaxID=2838724 RepID=A0A948X3U1_9LACO|nr:AAA family ATPase [Candidatus Paralactobacillus gallistercoris]
MTTVKFDAYHYPMLAKYCQQFVAPDRPITGRDREVQKVLGNLLRPEVSNIILLGEPGVGKTAIIKELSRVDTKRTYVNVDLVAMASNEGNTDAALSMANRMKKMMEDEVPRYQENSGHELVLFMDEFHLIAKISPMALQALKPLLAESGARHVHIIAATTNEEYDKYLRHDKALYERLQQLHVPELSTANVMNILRNMAKKYVDDASDIDANSKYDIHLAQKHIDDGMLHEIIDLTNRYEPDEVQPRKSILILDALIGRARQSHQPINLKMLQQVIMDTVGVNTAWEVDIDGVRNYLNQRVLNQKQAVEMVVNRLYTSVTDMNDHNRPQASMLFVGPTGVGKTELAKSLAHVLFNDDNRILRFDMAEYADLANIDLLRDRLAAGVAEHPNAIVLIEDVGKACYAAVQILAQILDDARLSDSHSHQQVSFKNTYIIMTANMEQTTDPWLEQQDVADSNYLANYDKYIRSRLTDPQISTLHFPRELINRLDTIVPFTSLSVATLSQIADKKIAKLVQMAKLAHHVDLKVAAEVVPFLIKQTSKNANSEDDGLAIKRRIDGEITTRVARMLFEHPSCHTLSVVINGENNNQHIDVIAD